MSNDNIEFRTKPYPLTAEARIPEIVATFALENMPLTEQDIQELWDIENGKTTTEEVHHKLINQYKQ